MRGCPFQKREDREVTVGIGGNKHIEIIVVEI